MAKVTITLCLAVLINCGTLLASERAPSQAVAKAHAARSILPHIKSTKLKTLYTNLGSNTDSYDSANGWLVSGRSGPFGFEQQMAMPFTVKKNSHVARVKIAISHYENNGYNGATVGIYSNAHGYPGKSLKSVDIKNMPPYGDPCCDALETVSMGKVKVSKGKRYWLVGTDSIDLSVDLWYWTYNDALGNFDFSEDTSWYQYHGNLCAFGIFGTTP